MAQIVLLALGRGQLLAQGGHALGRGAPAGVRRPNRLGLGPEPAERVQDGPMGLRVEQAALVELAVHLDQEVAELAQQAGARRRCR